MKLSSGKQLLINLYRALAVTLVFIPLILNVIVSADIVTSLLYSPMYSLFLAFFLASLDKKLMALLTLNSKNSGVKDKFAMAMQQTNNNINQKLLLVH